MMIKAVGVALYDIGKTVRLLEKKPISHMLKDSNMVADMPRAHPGIQVQEEVGKDI